MKKKFGKTEYDELYSKNQLRFDGYTVPSLNLYNRKIDHLIFENCDFNGYVKIDKYVGFELQFINCSFSNDFEINEFKPLFFPIQNNDQRNWRNQHVKIHNCTFDKSFNIDESKFINLSINNCTAEEEFSFSELYAHTNLTISNNTLKSLSLRINRILLCQIAKNVLKEYSSIILSYPKTNSSIGDEIDVCNHLMLLQNKILETLSVFNISPAERTKINDVSYLQIAPPADSKGEIDIFGVSLEELYISGVNNSNRFRVSGCELKQLKFLNLTNQSTIEFDDIRLPNSSFNKGILKVNNSVLGKIYFKNVNFSIFKDVEISESSISEIVPINPTWFTPEALESIIKSNEKRDENPVERYRQIRDVFKQLKIVADKSSEKQAFLNFRAKEFLYFYKELVATKPFYNRDRIVLWLNQSNSFGVNWVKPIILNLGIALFFFVLFVFIIGDCEIQNFKMNFSKYLNDYPQLLNPARDLAKIFPKDKLILSINLLDYLHRALLSYLIFQTIIAFRKFSQ